VALLPHPPRALMHTETQTSSFLVAAPEGARLLGVSERRFHDLRRQPSFPAAVVLGARCVRWHRDELGAYAKSLPRVTLLPEPKHLQRTGA
jgi:predicted DNA-binding transcriptional regulator AlpA